MKGPRHSASISEMLVCVDTVDTVQKIVRERERDVSEMMISRFKESE